MGRTEWTDENLTRQRQVGDPVGDAAIAAIFQHQDMRALDLFMGQLVSNDQLPADLPTEIAAFLDKTVALPTWAKPELLHAGARIFNIYGGVSLTALVCASLPECYTMRIGVRILDLTHQLGQHTNRRLHQTAAMVLAVMGPQGFEAGGRAVRQTQKVRLIHAAIRYRILSALGAPGVAPAAGSQVPVVVTGAYRSVNDIIAQHGFDWQIARDGMPINQEDLAFTLLTFGHVIPRALRTCGIKLSAEEYEAFLHCWNVSGYILGVDESLMAHTEADAADLFARIKARQAGPCPEGTRLTDSLLGVVEKDVLRYRILHPLAPILTRMFVGDGTAAMLGMDVRHPGLIRVFHRMVVAALRTIQILMTPLSQVFQPMVPLAAKIGLRVVDCLCAMTDDGKFRQVAIPPGWR